MPKRFGKPKGPSKEDIEAQAQREVERLTRASMGPTGGPMGGGGMGPGAPGGLPTPLDNIARSLKGRSVKQGPRRPAKEPSLLPQGPVGSSLVGGNKPGVTNPFGEVPQGEVGDSLNTGVGSYDAPDFDEDYESQPGYGFINDEDAEDEEINITEMA
ncbi:MAG: hypothetical protein M3Z84_07545, partial [Actinomycetota bacterium]|nr:hypothetical protein [Actinomycetota bacterium]